MRCFACGKDTLKHPAQSCSSCGYTASKDEIKMQMRTALKPAAVSKERNRTQPSVNDKNYTQINDTMLRENNINDQDTKTRFWVALVIIIVAAMVMFAVLRAQQGDLRQNGWGFGTSGKKFSNANVVEELEAIPLLDFSQEVYVPNDMDAYEEYSRVAAYNEELYQPLEYLEIDGVYHYLTQNGELMPYFGVEVFSYDEEADNEHFAEGNSEQAEPGEDELAEGNSEQAEPGEDELADGNTEQEELNEDELAAERPPAPFGMYMDYKTDSMRAIIPGAENKYLHDVYSPDGLGGWVENFSNARNSLLIYKGIIAYDNPMDELHVYSENKDTLVAKNVEGFVFSPNMKWVLFTTSAGMYLGSSGGQAVPVKSYESAEDTIPLGVSNNGKTIYYIENNEALKCVEIQQEKGNIKEGRAYAIKLTETGRDAAEIYFNNDGSQMLLSTAGAGYRYTPGDAPQKLKDGKINFHLDAQWIQSTLFRSSKIKACNTYTAKNFDTIFYSTQKDGKKKSELYYFSANEDLMVDTISSDSYEKNFSLAPTFERFQIARSGEEGFLVYLTKDGGLKAVKYDITTGEMDTTIDIESGVTNFQVSKQGDTLCYSKDTWENSKGTSELAQFSFKTRQTSNKLEAPVTITNFSYCAGGGAFYTVRSTKNFDLQDMYYLSPEGKTNLVVERVQFLCSPNGENGYVLRSFLGDQTLYKINDDEIEWISDDIHLLTEEP